MYSSLIHFRNIHTFTYQKTLLHTLLLLVSKIVESFQCILKQEDNTKIHMKMLNCFLSFKEHPKHPKISKAEGGPTHFIV